jgi:hypothetical protein
MIGALSKAMMSLAMGCLGESRREWALAMRGELEVAIEDGASLAFASGCLIVAWREMPRHPEGRFALARYALALGLLVPMAAFQFACAMDFPNLFGGTGMLGVLDAGTVHEPYLASAQISAVPVLLLLWLALGVAHLRLAWLLVEQDWTRSFNVGALTAAATVTFLLFAELLCLDSAPLMLQAGMLGIELLAVVAAARWHTRISLNFPAEVPT